MLRPLRTTGGLALLLLLGVADKDGVAVDLRSIVGTTLFGGRSDRGRWSTGIVLRPSWWFVGARPGLGLSE